MSDLVLADENTELVAVMQTEDIQPVLEFAKRYCDLTNNKIREEVMKTIKFIEESIETVEENNRGEQDDN